MRYLMAKPSLRASPTGQQSAEQALKLAGLTKKSLSEAVGCSRQPVTNFFKGVAIEQPLFIELCDRLTLDWQTVAGLTPTETKPPAQEPSVSSPQTIDQIVHQLRQTARSSLRSRCGTMRVLDMSRPMGLSDLYTSVNILEEITGHQRRRLQDLIEEVEAANFDRLGFGQVAQARVPAMEAIAQYNRLIVLGKPGAGKTTFLKHLAVQCIEGQFKPEQLPLFVNLKQFAESPDRPSLIAFISHRHLKSELTSLRDSEVEAQQRLLKQAFIAGRTLILLDGLDEVNQEEHDRVLREIRVLSEEFPHNQFLMTCRIAAWEYTFEQFTEVEIADFDPQQVATFARQWFRGKAMQPHTFLRSLARQPRLRELAVTPLLLTLLCLAFEASGSLPGSRSELYREGVETLLKKWDASRGIHRDQVYRRLSVKRKEDLLGQIALTTFQQRQYFLKQSHLEQYISDYIRNLPEASDDPAILQIDSATILHSIEAQHGLLVERAKHYYSFSHLTFHEYFVARELVFNSASLEKTMQQIVDDYALDPQWREVFLLVSELLRDADLLLSPLLQRIQTLVAGSSKLQAFLADISHQATQAKFSPCKPAAVRAFIFDIDFDIDQNREVAVRLDRSANWLVCASFLTRMLEGVDLDKAITIVQTHDQQVTNPNQRIAQATSANDAMMIAIAIALNSKQLSSGESRTLTELLHRLDQTAPNDENIQEVADAARHVAKDRHHIGQGQAFDAAEKRALKQYYRATRLLVDCLYSDGCMLSPDRRQQIEDTLFTSSESRANNHAH